MKMSTTKPAVVDANPLSWETTVPPRRASQSLKVGKLSKAFRTHSYCPR